MMLRSELVNGLKKAFSISKNEMRRIIKDFHLEMEKGLSGKNSSLKMLPAYVDRPTGNEKGRFLAIDLGGTNFRILELTLKGKRKISIPKAMKFKLARRYIIGSGEEFFDFLASCVKIFIKRMNLSVNKEIGLGFTFSFPVRQTGIDSGTLLVWTKGFSANGVVGKDVVRLLKEAFARKALGNVRVRALANDTVGTLVARSYCDPTCDIGVIIGTGTNACYVEDASNIRKWKGPMIRMGRMIINIEWGNFNKLRLTGYDKMLDKESDNPGKQILEKMVSGMYLGEVARLIFKDIIKRKALFGGNNLRLFNKSKIFKTESMSLIEKDGSAGLEKAAAVLRRLGIRKFSLEDRRLIKRICEILSTRASRVSAAAIASVVTKMDPRLSRRHAVAIDGSVYEKHPRFPKNMKLALRELFGKKASRISIVLAKDGSGKGAAICAAIAASNPA